MKKLYDIIILFCWISLALVERLYYFYHNDAHLHIPVKVVVNSGICISGLSA